jgi:tetratricopeptide (TPR) repeat protein
MLLMKYSSPGGDLRIALILVLFACSPTLTLAQAPADLLAQADRLADLGNWSGAGPLYSRAEAVFRENGDIRNEVYAKLGRLHRDEEAGSYRAVRNEAMRILNTPLVQNDAVLHIRALALIGTIDLNLNTAAALDDWTQVREIAVKAGDPKWENRATGQLGLVAGVTGNIAGAGMALSSSMAKAEQLGDAPAYLHFATWLANGTAVNGMADRALGILDRADAFARKHGFSELPLQLSIARVRALMNLTDAQRERGLTDAGKLIPALLAQAERDHVAGAETELLNAAGEIAALRKDFNSVEKFYLQAVTVAASASLPREEGATCLNLSRFYRATKQFPKASSAIDRGIRAVQRVEEAYDLPVYVAERAEVQSTLGDVQAADASFQRATSLVEGLLVNAPSSQVKSGMIGAMSDIYLGHFRLAWEQLHNAPYAFEIIETARGRASLDSIRSARQTGPATPTQVRTENEISRLQRSLMHDPLTPAQTKHALDLLDRAYMQLRPVELSRQKEIALLRRNPVTVQAVQSHLRPEETLIEYVLDEHGSHAIRIRRDGPTRPVY